MRAEVQLRRDVAGEYGRWFRGEVDEQWLLKGWVVVRDVERWVRTGKDSWVGKFVRQRYDAPEVWFPRESVERLLVRPAVTGEEAGE